jgi:putative ABC transport system substrate-binding protein
MTAAAVDDRLGAFRQAMRELGHVEEQTISIEQRYAGGQLTRVPGLAAELVRLKVDVILSAGPAATGHAMKQTPTIPIVMAFDTDPVGNGFVASLARPGRNVTGLSALSPEISGKQLELLKEVVPKLIRVGVLATSTEPDNARALKEAELAARASGIKLQTFDIRDSQGIDRTFRDAAKTGIDAILVLTSPFTFAHRTRVADLATKHRLPAVYWAPEYVASGGLIAYSVSFTDLYRRAAGYVDKILKGSKPADLPVQQPTKFELVVNLKAAKQIGLTIPSNVLPRADQVIR